MWWCPILSWYPLQCYGGLKTMIRGMGFKALSSFHDTMAPQSDINGYGSREIMDKGYGAYRLEIHGLWVMGYESGLWTACAARVCKGVYILNRGHMSLPAVFQAKQRWWHRNSFLALRHWIPNLIMQAGGFLLEKMGGDPIYGTIMGKRRWTVIFGGALFSNKTMSVMSVVIFLGGRWQEFCLDGLRGRGTLRK